jgi:hypothetical protein
MLRFACGLVLVASVVGFTVSVAAPAQAASTTVVVSMDAVTLTAGVDDVDTVVEADPLVIVAVR